MKFLLDAQLPPSLCGWFEERGLHAEHVVTLASASLGDAAIATIAERGGYTLLSKDEDFLALRLPDRFPLLWLRCGNITNKALREWLDDRWPVVEPLLVAGEGLIEVR